ncbi:MAG: GDP-mannose 4,6-dehydratase [Brachyspira sp.]|nr:GDP-mannose 4,6-dehydratase [Brachyspira sp.]
MNYLITGGAGFIGSSLTERLLDDNNKIFVIDNFNDYYDVNLKEKNIQPFLANKNYKLYRGDICDRNLVKEIFRQNHIDVVVHIAARAGVRPSLEDPLEYVRSNIEGTINILENMKEFSCKKIVFASSSSVYGNCTAEKFSEDLKVTEPISPYAATKSACEQFLYTYSKLYGINAVCLRFFTVYGPKQRPDLAIRKFIELIEQDKSIPVYGDGSTMRDYTYIEDILNGICAAIEYDKTPYEIINLGGGSPVTLSQMIRTIEKVLNKQAKIERLPMQPGDVNKTVSDISKAQKLLNYEPKTTFEEGIKKFVEWKRTVNND